jgi:hypothetical protein
MAKLVAVWAATSVSSKPPRPSLRKIRGPLASMATKSERPSPSTSLAETLPHQAMSYVDSAVGGALSA